jgi:HAD superfamily hydrolase (TIGR01509 family)
MIPHPLDAVVFDMDGLLLDTEVLFRDAIMAAGAGLGHEVTDALFLSLVGNPPDVSDGLLMAHFGDAFPIDDFRRACASEWRARCADVVPLRPGALELLEHLAEAGVPRAVATSTPRDAAESHLTRAGIRHLLDVVVTRTDVTHGKPHPETFLTAAERLGARPAHCLALEDSHNGVRAAHAAGMSVVMVPDTLSATEEMHRLCAAVVDSLHLVRARLKG